MSNKTKFVYFIAYSAIKNGLASNGTCSLARNRKLTTMAEIKAASEFLKNEWEYDSLMITNFILINKKGIL